MKRSNSFAAGEISKEEFEAKKNDLS
ncbi:MAG: hypothetical protein GF398_10925 [Chitinivibrionales bacterium]|nr:hypothetical protein [Chitinivibrionales bacterium]